MLSLSDIFQTSNDVYDITNIKDKFNLLRYSIVALNFDDKKFILKVKEYHNQRVVPEEIVREEYNTKEDLLTAYNKMVDDYIAVVRIKDKDNIRAEDIFDDTVDYHIKFPKCCLNCKYSVTDCVKSFPRFTHLVCINQSNVRTYNKLLKDHGMTCKMARNIKVIHPRVSEFGICKNYKENKDKINTIMSMLVENTMRNDEDFGKLKNHGVDFHDLKCREI